ncbi:Trihelix transcription factor GT-1 [Dissostichus eleginoides]|uniref:Trihelix transcription factor GT-1 n=1 Tax=Dissostichus eleginoides TaxID=100907 RepID=A0AAD9BPA5_DISEL|nr:Trihelix transcription factor GT-1 [Dissostichus eleginoides]
MNLCMGTEAQTRALVKHRTENEHLFTGKRCTAKKAWGEVLQKMGLEELLTPTQLSNTWENLKRQYKELKTLPTGTGTDEGEATAATWPLCPQVLKIIMVLKFNWVHTWSREQPCQSVSLAMSASFPPHRTWWNQTNVPNILCRLQDVPRCEADIVQDYTGSDE